MKKINLYPLFVVFCVLDLALIAWTAYWFINNRHF
jgi:hypothetical protein